MAKNNKNSAPITEDAGITRNNKRKHRKTRIKAGDDSNNDDEDDKTWTETGGNKKNRLWRPQKT